ncbi:MAG: hypothetical protein V1844_01385 [Pseudomonadota bacterium]
MSMQSSKTGFDQNSYRRIFGFANEYKEGDEAIEVATPDATAREIARKLLSNSPFAHFFLPIELII